MAKTLTIEIKSMGDALEGFRKTFKAVARGERVRWRAVPWPVKANKGQRS